MAQIKGQDYIGLGAYIDLGSLVIGEPSSEILTHGVGKATFALKVSGVDSGQSVTVRLEGRINDTWFNVFDRDIAYAQDGGYRLSFNDCETVQGLRLIAPQASGGTPTVQASAMVSPPLSF